MILCFFSFPQKVIAAQLEEREQGNAQVCLCQIQHGPRFPLAHFTVHRERARERPVGVHTHTHKSN